MKERSTSQSQSSREERWKTLFVSAVDGNSKDYNDLLGELSGAIKAFLLTRVSNKQVVDDILQEVLLSLHVARNTYDRTRPFSPWLFTIVRCRMIDFFRKAGRYKSYEVLTDELISNLGTASSSEVEVALKDAIGDLSDRKKEAIRLVVVEGKSTEESAKAMNLKESTFRVMYHRVVKSIKENL